MKDYPVLFSKPMREAILAGAKTQTRRVIRWPEWALRDDGEPFCAAAYGLQQTGGVAEYRDGLPVHRFTIPWRKGRRLWVKESRFSTRASARILLEITRVHIQQLCEIGVDDAIAEGVQELGLIVPTGKAQEAFAELWDKLNGKRAPWKSNPWVAAITFRVVWYIARAKVSQPLGDDPQCWRQEEKTP